MRTLIKRILHPFYKRYHFWYHSKPRKYTYKNVYTIIQPSVFSPKNTVSTKVFLDYISFLDLNKKNVLELGCGSGIISIFSASKGAIVTASDINEIAIKSLISVSYEQNINVNVMTSDLFNNIRKQFDYIFINPPYYPKKPINIEEQAWFCGDNFEYFESLFLQLPENIYKKTKTLMILSNDCAINRIQEIGRKNNLEFNKILTKIMKLETNYIFEITPK